MQDKPTNELNAQLEKKTLADLDIYLNENRSYMADEKLAFYYYMKDVLDRKRIRLKDVYSSADVSESYGSKIIRMEKHTRNRDMIIRLCLAGHFSLDEMNRALKLYGFRELYSKNARDVMLILLINDRIFDIYEIDEKLQARGYEPLKSDSCD
uniref:hypothetical protein n=1 Tax=Eubacterium cellulosolvens TaxID=29322 RepID=UPI00048588F7|nr:hypothetical protein [[Eubacterium] cellulosolvens]